jgi:hypothetical protein
MASVSASQEENKRVDKRRSALSSRKSSRLRCESVHVGNSCDNSRIRPFGHPFRPGLFVCQDANWAFGGRYSGLGVGRECDLIELYTHPPSEDAREILGIPLGTGDWKRRRRYRDGISA